MKQPSEQPLHKRILSLAWKILLPFLIGGGVAYWLFKREFDPQILSTIHLDWRVWACVALACVFVFGREWGMAWRFRVLSDEKLGWLSCFKVVMLCEFTSCVTPTSFGGSALGMFFLHGEGVHLGRATALMMTTIFLDELFLVLSLPLFFLIVPYADIFGFVHDSFALGLRSVFWVVYILLGLWTILLYLGIFVRPQAIHRFLNRIFSFRWLRRWAEDVDKLGCDMELTGKDLRNRPLRWWLESFGATAASWLSRFLVVNALFLGFAPHADQLLVLARQFVVWVILVVSPTPGGAGISEWLFTTYYGDLITPAAMALIIALFWRVISYYVYLIIGAFIVPGWIKREFRNSKYGDATRQIENTNPQ